MLPPSLHSQMMLIRISSLCRIYSNNFNNCISLSRSFSSSSSSTPHLSSYASRCISELILSSPSSKNSQPLKNQLFVPSSVKSESPWWKMCCLVSPHDNKLQHKAKDNLGVWRIVCKKVFLPSYNSKKINNL